MFRLLFPLALLLSLMSVSVHAVLVEDLYQVELEVEDQTTAKRLAAFNDAFRLLLIKVSGSDEAFTNPGMQRPLRNSSRYVHQFRYLTRRLPDETEAGLDRDQLYLRVMFNRDLVESLLRENSVPLWGRERPSTLMVVHYREHPEFNVLVSGDTTPQVMDEIDEQARRQGLPLLFPLLDLEDRMALANAVDVVPDASGLDALFQRYSPDVMLSGSISMDQQNNWRADWQTSFAGKLFNWSNRAAERKQLVQQSLARLASLLASEFALKAVQVVDQDVMFRVEEVFNITDHVKVLNYLKSLDAVEHAGLVRIETGQALYRVRLRNTAEDLNRLISLGYVLEQMELPRVNAAEEKQLVRLHYRLIH